MAKRCGCASDTCACYLIGGDGVDVSGGGTRTNPYVVESSDEGRLLTVQDENTPILSGVVVLDFQGAGVSAASSGSGEVVVTVPGGGGGSLAIQDEGTPVQVGTQTLNFVGTGIQVTSAGGTAVTVTVQAPAAPPASAAGKVTTSLSTQNSKLVAVTFPAGRFSAAPAVCASVADNTALFGTVGSVTATGCQVGGSYRESTTTSVASFDVFWIARVIG